MQHVGQRLSMHQAVFDGDIEQSAEWKSIPAGRIGLQCFRQFCIQRCSDFLNIVPYRENRWPLRRLICWQTTPNRIDAKSKEAIELWIKTFQSKRTIMQKIPIERLEMSDVENDAMALGDGAIIKGVGIHDGEKLIGFLARGG